jgi:dihydroorotate dehydrogenase
VGLAAGFDKNALYVTGIQSLGFGFVEVGSVTAKPCEGNRRPRLFRLPADGALINRMGLNNRGAAVTAARLQAIRDRVHVPIFVNVAKTPDPSLEGDAAVADYVTSIQAVAESADAVVLNISCPNSGDGRTFEDPEAFATLVSAARPATEGIPLLVKISPDLDVGQEREVVRVAMDAGVDGLIASNTTVVRDGLVQTPTRKLASIGAGGMSGAPLFERAVACVGRLREVTAGRIPIIGVGGVSTGEHALQMLDAGASLVEVYTGFIYRGPFTVRRICEEMTLARRRLA